MTIAQQLKIKDFPFEIKDKDGNLIYYEAPYGFWIKSEYDSKGNEIYYENSYGVIFDNRPKTVEVSLEKIADMLGIKVEQLRIKD